MPVLNLFDIEINTIYFKDIQSKIVITKKDYEEYLNISTLGVDE